MLSFSSFLSRAPAGWQGQSRKSSERPAVTFVLLNWRRPANLRRIIASIKKQTVPTAIFLWNNGRSFRDSRVDWQINSSENRFCWPRWFMASMAESPYVATLDDDFCLGDPTVMADALAYMEGLDPFQIAGASGVILPPSLEYRESRMCGLDSPGQLTSDWEVDIIKGQHMLLRRESLLQRLKMPGPVRRGDDIILSGLFAEGRRRFHRCPALYFQRLVALPNKHALCLDSNHYQLRGEVARQYFRAENPVVEVERR